MGRGETPELGMARKKAKRRIGIVERAKRFFGRISDPEAPQATIAAIVLSLLVLVSLAGIYLALPDFRDGYWSGVFVEATGFFLDLVFFGIVLALIVHWRDKKLEGRRYQEEIQDFKHWDTEEGRLRIAGAIRRLGRLGKTDIDFRGIKLSDFSFKGNDIQSIRGSTFYDGEWGTLTSREEVSLKGIDFGFMDCSKVTFSRFNPFHGLPSLSPPVKIVDCSFCEANLRDAVFRGAVLEWAEPPAETIYEEVENSDGTTGLMQVLYPPFDGADLAGASFKEVHFQNADFRRAENLLEADFSGATGLKTCVFDNDEEKDQALAKANQVDSGRREDGA